MLLSLCQSFVVFCQHCCGKGSVWSCNANNCCSLQPAFVRQCSCLVWQCYLVIVVDGVAILIIVAARIGVWQCSQCCGFANGIVPYLRFACKKKNLQVFLANNHSVWCVCLVCIIQWIWCLCGWDEMQKRPSLKAAAHETCQQQAAVVYFSVSSGLHAPQSRTSMETWPEEAQASSLWWNLTGMRTGWYNLSMVVMLQ